MTKKVGHLSELERHAGQSALMIGTIKAKIELCFCNLVVILFICCQAFSITTPTVVFQRISLLKQLSVFHFLTTKNAYISVVFLAVCLVLFNEKRFLGDCRHCVV